MDGFNDTLRAQAGGMAGLSKISVQSGTSHGGVVLADGSIADVKLDLDTLERLSEVAREKYGLAGAVQHGASTLPDDVVQQLPADRDGGDPPRDELPEHAVRRMPADLRDEIYGWLGENAKDERKASDSDEQFFYKTRKKALGPFKRAAVGAGRNTRERLAKAYDEKFTFLFTQLGVGGTKEAVRRHVKPMAIHRPAPGTAGHIVVEAAPDDADLSD